MLKDITVDIFDLFGTEKPELQVPATADLAVPAPVDVFDLFGEPEAQRALLQPDPQWSREGGLYVIWLSPDRKHYYGGRAVCFSRRWGGHLKRALKGTHGNVRFQSTFNKYRFFQPEVLEIFTTLEEQIAAEQSWLDTNFGKPGCINLSHCSDGGCSGHTPESRAKMSFTHSTRPDLVEKARVTLSANRHFVTQEGIFRRAKITGEKLRGRVQPRSTVEKRADSNRGRKNTPETLTLMSESAKRRVLTHPTRHGQETRALISEQQRGRVWVNDGANNKRVTLQEASSLLGSGWVQGRHGGSPNKDRRLLVRRDPVSGEIIDRKLALIWDIPFLIEGGWENPPPKESSPQEESKRGHKGTVWVRRESPQGELECRRVSEEDLTHLLAEGWERGARKASLSRKEKLRTAWSDPERIEEARQRRATQKNLTTGTIWVWRDGDGFRRVPALDKDKWVSDGWVQKGPKNRAPN